PRPWPAVPTIVAPCRFVKQKGLDVLVRALAALKDQGVPFKAKLVGAGPLRRKIESEIGRLGLADRVTIEPWSSQEELWRDAELLVLSSRYEGWGRTIVEAMAARVPIVTTDVGCVGSFFRPQVDGRVVQPSLAAPRRWRDLLGMTREGFELVAAIREQLSESERREWMVKNAYARAKEFPKAEELVRRQREAWTLIVGATQRVARTAAGGRRAWMWTAVVIGFAIIVRGLSVALFWKTLGPNREWGFFSLVQNWFLGYGYSFVQDAGCVSAYRSPGFLFFLTGVYGLFGFANFFAQAVVQNALAVLLTYMVYRLGWALSKDRRVGLVAAFLTIIHPYTFYHYAQYYHTVLSGLFLVTLLFSLLRLEETKRLRWAVGTGVWIAALAYVQGTILPATVLLSAWLAWRWRNNLKRAVFAVTIMGAVSAALIAPWTIRNWQSFHRFVPLTTDLGHALAKANSENIYGLTVLGFPQEVQTSERVFNPENPLEVRYVMLPEAEAALRGKGLLKPSRLFSEWHPREPGETGRACATLSTMSEPEFNDYWTKVGMDWLKQNYWFEGWKLQALKVAGFWSPILQPGLKYGAQWSFADSGWKVLAARWSLAGYVVALEVLALAGLVIARRRKSLGVVVPVMIVFAVYTALHSVIAGYTKYRIPLDNLVAILAAVALVALWDRLRRRTKT
ncbi:MAG TPA: glycosyltransferase, partial [Candidatus Methylomirabilis sp.]|nr:glycosyltransferase [Candidatus Methylomirabilis sp.]